MFVAIKMANRDLDIPGLDIEDVKLFMNKGDAIGFIENDFADEKALLEGNDDARFNEFDGVMASIESVEYGVNALEWHLFEEAAK